MYGFSHHNSDVPKELKRLQERFCPRILKELKADVKERRQTKGSVERLSSNNEELIIVTGSSEILQALMDLSHARCAFCESVDLSRLNILHFRPTQYAHPNYYSEDLDFYSWFAFEWTNLFPICELCYPKDPSFFPMLKGYEERAYPSFKDLEDWEVWYDEGPSAQMPAEVLKSLLKKERPALLMPGEGNFLTEFSISETGILKPLTSRAEITIQNFNLNAEPTIKKRYEFIKKYEQEFFQNEKLNWNFKVIPFGGAWLLRLRQIVSKEISTQDMEEFIDSDDIRVAAGKYLGKETLLKQLSPEGRSRIESMLSVERKIAAVKEFRSETKLSIGASREAIEFLIQSKNWTKEHDEEDKTDQRNNTFASTDEFIEQREEGLNLKALIANQPRLKSITIQNFK